MNTITIIVDSVKVGKDMALVLVGKSPSTPTCGEGVAVTAIICGTILLAVIAICVFVCITSGRKKEKTTREILIGLLKEKEGEYMKSLKDAVVKTINDVEVKTIKGNEQV